MVMKHRILVVEDSLPLAERIRQVLEGAGYRVDLAADGREGLLRVQSEPPDLIISDLTMPEMDGYAFCQAIKSAELTKRIPFVLLDERNKPEDILWALERGADNFITKPFEDDVILERVRRIFEHLEFRQKGYLEMEVTVRVGGRDICITADKQQVIELLFATFEDLARANDALLEHERELEAKARELEEANQQLRAASRHKSEFLANMSHELRTPLNAILGFSELLQGQTPGPLTEKQARYVANISTGGQDLLGLITDLLDLARVEAGRMELHIAPVNLREMVEAVLHESRPKAAATGLSLELVVVEALPPVPADPIRLNQILQKLLSNAVKFNPVGGRVTVTVRIGSRGEGLGSSEGLPSDPKPYTLYPGEFIEIAVADTGIGIKAEDLPMLFQTFTQLEPTFAKRYQGAGLGLSLTKRLVELHGGRIWAESPGEGQGSTFKLQLPLKKRGAGPSGGEESKHRGVA
jgi:two-component system sensor histidine kinase/response regulator